MYWFFFKENVNIKVQKLKKEKEIMSQTLVKNFLITDRLVVRRRVEL